MTEKKDYSSILFTPEDVGVLGSAYLQQRRENKDFGIVTGLKSLDEDLYPLFPGELMGIIARPGCGKTGFMVHWARYRSEVLRKLGKKDRAVVYITLEQSIEELNAFNVAADQRLSITSMARGEIKDAEWNECLKSAINRRFMPLWNIGYSSMTTNKQIRVDLDAIEGALSMIRDQHKLTIDIVFVDYLQRMPLPGNVENKAIGVSDNYDGLKNIALRLKTPVVVGVQARREVDDRDDPSKNKLPIPELDDGQWTSNVEQSSDRLLSLVRPIKYRKENEMFGKMQVKGTRQILITVLKQKLGKDNWSKWAYFDPEYNKLDELEKGG